MSGLCVIDGVVVDPVAGPVLLGVLEAALGTYDEAPGIDGPCAAGIVAGAAVALDRGIDTADGCGGQLWVRLVNLYPSAAFPQQDQGPTRDPDVQPWAVVVEVGVARPAPMLHEVGDDVLLPSMEEEQDAALLAVSDGAILRHALQSTYGGDGEIGLVLGAYAPFGPEGGVVGGALTATIQVT